MIRSATPADSEAICALYNPYLETTITFEEAAISPAEMENRIRETLPSLPWLLWEQDGSVCGYAHASKWKGRCAYRHSAEVTVYLDPAFTGRGIGSKLYQALLPDLRERGFHTAIGGIALPNLASIALHQRLGFRRVAHFEQVGWKFGHWIDVVYWQLLL
jgi:L-amino acid N-acyltransferase YncA